MNIQNDANAFDLINGLVVPSMETFAENGIIERLVPSFASKRIEYECFLLSSLMTVLLARKSNPAWFKNSNFLFEMIQATIPFYESTGLNNLNNPQIDENKIEENIFERWSKYEKHLNQFNPKGDFSELYGLVYGFSDVKPWFVKDLELNKLKFKASILQCINLIANFGENVKT